MANNEWYRRNRAAYPERHRAYYRKADHKLKIEAMTALGSVCVICGFSDWRALEFDHIRGDGCLQRVNGKRNDTRATLRKHLRSGTINQVYQLLCCNCHSIKTHDKGEWKPRNHSV